MKKYAATKTGLGVGLVSALIGFLLRFNAHELSGTTTPEPFGSSTSYNLNLQIVYQELGLALIIFGLALLLIVFHGWLNSPHKNQLQRRQQQQKIAAPDRLRLFPVIAVETFEIPS